MFLRMTAVAAPVLAFACLVGCRTDPNTVYLERELRLQEDEIYRLQDTLDDLKTTLDQCRQENTALKGPRAGLGPAPSTKGVPLEERPSAPPPAATTAEPNGPELPSLKVEGPPLPSEAPPAPPAAKPTPVMPPLPKLLPGPGVAPPAEKPAAPIKIKPISTPLPGAASDEVTGVELDAASGGYARGGESGLEVVLRLRDRHGREVAAPGEISVVALDPRRDGDAARVARWDFGQEAVARHLGATPAELCLELPWPAATPAAERVHVFVRYTTADGRKLQADGMVSLKAKEKAGWTASSKPIAPRTLPTTADAARPVDAEAATTAKERQAEAAVDEPAAGPVLKTAAKPPKSGADAKPKRPVWSPHRR